ncbi:HsdM family class I SAM-dependent methyltransferase [Raoultibacter phocaeensis]|uniref:HsdM family class I SAM-dependent methyltransferase n=1 Tax=Raoultibacter phocaeensis TaxID=2479841 RepID=UPI00111B94B2
MGIGVNSMISYVEEVLTDYADAAETVNEFFGQLLDALSEEALRMHGSEIIDMLSARQRDSGVDAERASDCGAGVLRSDFRSLSLAKIAKSIECLPKEALSELVMNSVKRRLSPDGAEMGSPLCVIALTECMASVICARVFAMDAERLCATDFGGDGAALQQEQPGPVVFDCYPRDGLLLQRVGRRIGARELNASSGCALREASSTVFDLVVSMPPLNQGSWCEEEAGVLHEGDGTWLFGRPPAHKANFAWIESAVSQIADGGRACLIMPNDVMWTVQPEESEIKRRFIETGSLECVVALPSRLMPGTSLGLCLLVLAKKRRDRSVLMVDAKDLICRTRQGSPRTMSDDGIRICSSAYDSWLAADGSYADKVGVCRSVAPESVVRKKFLLAPELYVSERFGEEQDGSGSVDTRLAALREIDARIESASSDLYDAVRKLRDADA